MERERERGGAVSYSMSWWVKTGLCNVYITVNTYIDEAVKERRGELLDGALRKRKWRW